MFMGDGHAPLRRVPRRRDQHDQLDTDTETWRHTSSPHLSNPTVFDSACPDEALSIQNMMDIILIRARHLTTSAAFIAPRRAAHLVRTNGEVIKISCWRLDETKRHILDT